ncbi:MAG TPA: ATP-binding protein [Chloroflexota bacterium]|jgi:signal transduction histidine kinase
MSADDFIQLITQALYVLLFVVVAVRAAHRPLRANVDVTLLFGTTSLLIAVGWIVQALHVTPPPALGAFSGALLLALPYLLLRLLDDFAGVAPWLMRGAAAGLALSAVLLFVVPPPLPAWLALLMVAYFVALVAYVALAFQRHARHSSGVTRSRMRAVACGSAFLGLTLLVVGFALALPALADLWTILTHLTGLASGLCYFLGFAPPTALRRAWQEPELRAFLGRAASLPRLPDTDAIRDELERGAASALGAPYAAIGLWDEAAQVLRFAYRPQRARGPDPATRQREQALGITLSGETWELPPGPLLAGQTFAEQRPVFAENVARVDPANADLYRAYGVMAMLAAPITAGDRRLGVLAVNAPRAPIFADSDLELVRLLADQAAVILESRALIDEAARVRAREEATRLKDDFLSSAAHDLRTPLTTLLGQSQLLARQADRDGLGPEYTAGIDRLVREARRLGTLVAELLDASRAERGQLVGSRAPVNLTVEAAASCARHSSERHPYRAVADGAVVGDCDPVRIQQLLDNLVENAVKYSPAGGEVQVRVWHEAGEARLSVTDHGIGIPPADLPRLFERYHRGANVDDRRFSGLGLGLYICRGIAEQHGGRIWAESAPGQGAIFYVALPLAAAVAAAPADGGAP